MTFSLIFEKLLTEEREIADNKFTVFVKWENNRSLPKEMED